MFLYLYVYLGDSIQVDSFWNAIRAAKCGSERSNHLELTAHLGSPYNYGKVRHLYFHHYDYREGFFLQVGLP